MTVALGILLGIAILIDIQQTRYRRRIVKTSSELIAGLNAEKENARKSYFALRENYKALEDGQQEIIENYENDLLDMREKKEAAQNAAAYDREMREEAEKKIDRINEVVELHSTKCGSIIDDLAQVLVDEILPKEE